MGRSRAKKPTRTQKAQISAAGLIPRNWLVLSEDSEKLRLVSKRSGTTRIIKKAPPAATRQGHK